MQDRLQFYIGGKWVDPVVPKMLDVVDPAHEEPFARISLGSAADVDKAVAAARRAFESFSRTSKEERIALLQKILDIYQKRYGDIVQAISREMGAPLKFSKNAQAACGIAHFSAAIGVLKEFSFLHVKGTTAIAYEPVGVCGLITPWNWPINQIACKVAPALAAGCTMVLKPSEIAPMSAIIFAEILHEAGVPAGVFNLVNGDGPTVGEAIAAHPDVDMVSFTGSTRAGIAVAKAAADTVKRVASGAGRQVAEYHSRRRRSRESGRRRVVDGLFRQFAASPAMRRRACSCRATGRIKRRRSPKTAAEKIQRRAIRSRKTPIWAPWSASCSSTRSRP